VPVAHLSAAAIPDKPVIQSTKYSAYRSRCDLLIPREYFLFVRAVIDVGAFIISKGPFPLWQIDNLVGSYIYHRGLLPAIKEKAHPRDLVFSRRAYYLGISHLLYIVTHTVNHDILIRMGRWEEAIECQGIAGQYKGYKLPASTTFYKDSAVFVDLYCYLDAHVQAGIRLQFDRFGQQYSGASFINVRLYSWLMSGTTTKF
jgi:hypothetical protein